MIHSLRLSIFAVITHFSIFATASENPPDHLRVLWFDPSRSQASKDSVLHQAMAELGRDAIYFDYTADAGALTEAYVKHFPVVMMAASDKVPATLSGKKLITTEPGTTVAQIREEVLSAANKDQWLKFLGSREPEVREPHPQVANYEKRPEAITFQHPFKAKGSIERTQVPADMRLELFASDPDIGKPIAMAWDERGRCWVAETFDYPHGVKPDGQGNDRITICEDTNGDGRADKFTVFAEGLNIPTGLVLSHGGVIVSQPPRFLFLKDTNGDDKADVRKEIMTGWGIGDTHAQANNLHYGYDNWIHGCVGYSNFDGTVNGKAMKFGMGTYRFKADGSEMEFLHQFTNNAWAQSFNAVGDSFGGTANGAPIFYGGIPANTFPKAGRFMSAKKINAVDVVHTVTPNFRQVDVFGGFTSAAGSAFIESANLPARLQGRAMICEPTMKVITLMDAQPDGAGYKALDDFNVLASSDEWTSPVYAEVGPDGAIWVADFQNFIIQHNPTPSVARGGFDAKTGVGGAHENDLRDHRRGRIYRIVWDQAKPEKKSLQQATTAQLVDALADDTQHWRLTAQRLLVEGKKVDAADALKAIITTAANPIQAIHALWTLQGLGLLDAETSKSALLAKDAALRRNAIRSLGSDADAANSYFSSGVMSDPDPQTRLAALIKLANFPTTPEIQQAIKNLSRDESLKKDEWLNEAITQLGRHHDAVPWKEGPNLLPNPGFDKLAANGLPEGWTRRDYDYSKPPGNATAEWSIVKENGQFHAASPGFRCITRDSADTSFFADVALKPNTQYRLSGWIKTHAFRGRASLNIHGTKIQTETIVAKGDWREVEVIFNSGELTKASVNLLHVAKGDTYFDDVKLSELVLEDADDQVLVGDAKNGEKLFLTHPVAACLNCHMLGGKGSPVGPALDGIAGRKDEAYLLQSLLEPNAVMAENYTATPISPMPPMNLILKNQEIADLMAFLMTLK
ncbi:c-type cytochrome [Phragmitibacter flavus]|uniref:C-type cytochrome n=1 Tax=Phragmitibacter flavus TaxID=2576071 RepID=A0A5R8K8G1_9BACT|nr:PVC-type heme-binding CxxCH protein [Phragmitibacter flavus]TLD68618.1 c-type cytochrome [Phragmitibacter flavus]